MYNGGQNFLNFNRTGYGNNQQVYNGYTNQNIFTLPQINQLNYLTSYFPQQPNQQLNYKFRNYTPQQPSVNSFTPQQYNFINTNWQNIKSNNFNVENKKQESLNRKNLKKAHFTIEEDIKLKGAVKVFGTSNWKTVSEVFSNRTPRQCRERYNNYLAENINLKPWSKLEDELLLKLQGEIGNRWVMISRRMGNGRTENNVKRRFYFLMEKKTGKPKKETLDKKDISDDVIKNVNDDEPIINLLDPKIFEEIDKLDKIFYFDEKDFGFDYS